MIGLFQIRDRYVYTGGNGRIDFFGISSNIFRNRPQGRFNFANHNHTSMSQFINYLKDTQTELKHVSWPTHRQSIIYTVLVVVISIVVALFVGLADFGFTKALDWFIK